MERVERLKKSLVAIQLAFDRTKSFQEQLTPDWFTRDVLGNRWALTHFGIVPSSFHSILVSRNFENFTGMNHRLFIFLQT
jgi:hypothetical protein